MASPPRRIIHFGWALRHRDYRLFFAGQSVSLIGTWIHLTAQAWLVYRLGGSAEWLGIASFVSQAPMFFLPQFGGVVADRYDRRRVLLLTQALSMILALTLGMLTISHSVCLWHVLVISGLLGIINAFDMPARHSFVVELVGGPDLANAIALNSSVFNGARLIGPAVAGIAVAALGEAWCFLVNAVTFLALIAGLLAMRRSPFAARPRTATMWRDMRDGIAFAAGTPPIRILLLLVGTISFFAMPCTVLMPIFAGDVLGGGSARLGILMSAVGFGAMSGALALAARTSIDGYARTIRLVAVGFAGALILFSQSHWLWLAAVALVMIGFCQMTLSAASNTLIQSIVPDRYRGRTMALYTTMFIGMTPFGSLAAGYAASGIGAPATVAVSGLLALVIAALSWRRLRDPLGTEK
ncbi:MAG TPA: MFS transporter [Rhodospirillaceae bacterium]|nr:MFS transporter [Rhodospirillaceae bacterium]